MNLDKFTQAYIECTLWSSTDESNEQGGDPLGHNYTGDDIAPEAMKQIIADCEKFQSEAVIAPHFKEAGHDFWITRNGHGAGFWDGDWPDGEELTRISHSFGECSLYVGDDGQLYLQ